MTSDWYDDDAGPVVRPYALTGGRVDPAGFDLIAHVVTRTDSDGSGVASTSEYHTPEQRAILALTAHPCSVAEVAANMNLPLGVVRVLLADMHSDGLIERYDPPSPVGGPTEQLLQAVIHGLRAI